MLLLRKMTLSELEDYEQELNLQEEEHGYSLYSQKIDVYEEMYDKIKKRVLLGEEDRSYLDYVTKRLLFYLIHFGTYLKMEYEKDDDLAKKCLKKALVFDKHNPIAAYRLGFLSYKSQKYQQALLYFQKAIDNQKYIKHTEYYLNEKQIMNAYVYLTNSALYIAKKTYDEMVTLPFKYQDELQNYEFSSLYERLKDNEKQLEQNAFYKITKEEETTCSKEDCDEIITNEPFQTVVLYFHDRRTILLYHDHEVNLTQRQADLLCFLLTKSSENTPATRFSFSNLFLDSRGEVKRNTFIQTVNRLKNKMQDCSIPPIIQTKSHKGETGYYFDGSIPFIVMYRVDTEMELL